MSTYPGNVTEIKIGASPSIVAEVTKITGGGIENALKDASTLASSVNKYAYGRQDGGTVHVEAWMDPTDTNGQIALRAAAVAQTSFTVIELHYGAETTEYFKLSTGATALVTNVSDIDLAKDASGLIAISFDLKISGGYFEQAS